MIVCPTCHAENAPGKLFCYKCGTKFLPESDANGKVISRLPQKKKEKKSVTGIAVTIIIILALGGFIFLSWQQPQLEMTPISRKKASVMYYKLQKIKELAGGGKGFKASFSEKSITSYINEKGINKAFQREVSERLRKPFTLERAAVGIKDGTMRVIFILKWKQKSFYLLLIGKPTWKDGYGNFTLHKVQIGKLPLPGFLGKLALKIFARGSNPLQANVPPYVKGIGTTKNKLILKINRK